MQRDYGALFQKLLNWRIVVNTWGYMESGIDPPCVDDVDGWFIKDCMSHGQLRLSCFSVPNM